MTFDYVLGRATPGTRAAFTVEVADRGKAEDILVERMVRAGWRVAELLHWHIVSVVEIGRHG